ncbi:MAG: hypothetical protein IPK16_23645 [Anaerolineales bacterium]|nr:hypothetical protein [Anaerolineales bacterium]
MSTLVVPEVAVPWLEMTSRICTPLLTVTLKSRVAWLPALTLTAQVRLFVVLL